MQLKNLSALLFSRQFLLLFTPLTKEGLEYAREEVRNKIIQQEMQDFVDGNFQGRNLLNLPKN